MSKIKITESELKEIISESVKGMINEYKWNKYGTPWNMLSDTEKKNYAYYYANKYRAWKTDGKGNYIYQNGKAVPDYNKLEQIYNQEQEKYQHKGNRGQYSQGHIENLNQQKNQLNVQLKQVQNLNDGYKNAIQQIAQALRVQLAEAVGSTPAIDSSWSGTGAVTVPTPEQNAEMLVKSAVPQLPQILKAIETLKGRIETLKGRVAQLTKANQTLTNQNKSLTQRVQNDQSQKIASPIATPKATVQAPTQPATLARPKAAAPGNAQA